MSNTNDNEVAITYASGTSSVTTPKPLNSNNRFDFDAKAIHADAVMASLWVKADNQGTAASGDYVDLWIKWSPDASEFDTDEHAMWLGRLDTFATNDPGEDPAAKLFRLDVSGKQAFKLMAKPNQGATRTINLTAIYNEHRMA